MIKMKRLVVVESPTKARTIRKYLPTREFAVEASMGHVRDLPASAGEIPAKYKGESWARLGVNVEDKFNPLYVVPSDKKKVVKQLKDALKGADELYIATDEDREGESIGWHLLEVLKPKVPVRRMVFHEITKEAILSALDHTRDMNEHLVGAQETRRILDRLFGYTISPLLWKKIAPKLSAGRVQSVAVRLIVMREKERIAFVPASFWALKAILEKDGSQFDAVLTQVGGIRVALGRDFDDETGKLKKGLTEGKNILVLGEANARALAAKLPAASWNVTKVDERTATRSPAPPFITSTLQQEASRKLGLPARQTMRVAQKLYEQGFISYMRTDSTNLSKEALEACRRSVVERYGKEYLSPGPRTYEKKVRNAQEAHEAIRPAGKAMKTREELGLNGQEGSLYDLIWKRTVATQMADARLRMVTATIEAGSEEVATFRASGRTILFPGFFRAYVEGSDDPNVALEHREQPLPALSQGDHPGCDRVEADGKKTKPPSRYTEASLVKTLEKEGIGRPSTYASIIDTIVNRGYVRRKSNQLMPSFTAFATNNLLEQQFSTLVDIGFTAGMEQVLDDIADGKQEAAPYLNKFYRGASGIESQVDAGLDAIDARKVSTISFPKWGDHSVRVGRYGPYVEKNENGERIVASIPDDLAPSDVTDDVLTGLLRKAGNKEENQLGIHPETEQPVTLREGPYGHYVQLGENGEKGKPKRMSLPKGLAPEDVNFEIALELLRLPRTLGEHPETGKPILANIGRYGPYVQHERTFASLTDDDDVLTVDLDRALALIKQKTAKNKPLRELGPHPKTGEVVGIWAGRYGPYVKHQKLNASLPKNGDPEKITMEEALELLAARAASKGKGRGRRKKK